MEHEESRFSAFGRRVAAWLIILVAVVLALKLVGGIVIGFIQMILVVALLGAVAVALLWAFRHI